MEVGQAVYASDLKLPPGVTLQVEPDTLVLHVIAARAEQRGSPRKTAEAAGGAAEAAGETAADAKGVRSDGP